MKEYGIMKTFIADQKPMQAEDGKQEIYLEWPKHMRIRSLLAYELSLINGCGTHENNICGHSFF